MFDTLLHDAWWMLIPPLTLISLVVALVRSHMGRERREILARYKRLTGTPMRDEPEPLRGGNPFASVEDRDVLP